MKWFFAVTEDTLTHADHDFPGLVKAAAASALRNTSLRPNLIFDGAECALTRDLRGMGVTIIRHQLSMGPYFKRHATPDYPLLIALGAYLRTDIPEIEREDEMILYTDCDVLFLREPTVPSVIPGYFSCAPERHRDDYNAINTGVMWMNLNNLRQDLPVFRHFVQQEFLRLVAFDQGAYIDFYRGRWDRLPIAANWKPYWGINPDAEIVHFHGPKPEAVRKRLCDPAYRAGDVWGVIMDGNDTEYRYYLELWDSYRSYADTLIGAAA